MFDLYYQLGNARRRPFKVKGSICSIGSARNNDLVLDTRMIAKRHAEFRLLHDGIYLKDLGSLGGCWVNRERIVDHGPLSELDEITIGDVNFVLSKKYNMVSSGANEQRSDSTNQNRLHTQVNGNSDLMANSDEDAPSFRQSMLSIFGMGDKARTGKNISSLQCNNEDEKACTDRGVESSASGSAPSDIDSISATDQHRLGNPLLLDDEMPSLQTDCAVTPATAGLPVDKIPSLVGEIPEIPISELMQIAGQSESAQSEHKESLIDERLTYWGGIIHEQLLYQMDLRRKDVNRMSDEQLREESLALINGIIESLSEQIPDDIDLSILQNNVLNESVGLGPLEKFLSDEEVTEIMVNNYREIFIEKNGRLERSQFQFSSDRTVYAVIERIITPLGRRIDESSPIVDARLKDGSRVNAIIPPLALKGPSLTIRKFPKLRLKFDDLVSYGSIDQKMVDFLRVCVEMKKNIIVSGGTGSGKTTLLNVLSNFIPDTDRVVTIEDAAELKLVQPNLVSLESRPANLEGKGEIPIRDLVKNSLRMRPDRIVVGECRGGEAIDMLQAMNTGHDGSLTTIHANNPRDVISRLEVLVLMAGMDLPVTAIREQVASAVHMIIQQTRFPCGSRKVTKITEVVGMESGTVQLQDIFVFQQNGVDELLRVRGSFRPTGAIPTFYENLREMGIEVDLGCFSHTASERRS
ncbi:MAG: ATPase, T2SS/T4P/T4SS family [Granulosicoccus sp.]